MALRIIKEAKMYMTRNRDDYQSVAGDGMFNNNVAISKAIVDRKTTVEANRLSQFAHGQELLKVGSFKTEGRSRQASAYSSELAIKSDHKVVVQNQDSAFLKLESYASELVNKQRIEEGLQADDPSIRQQMLEQDAENKLRELFRDVPVH